MASKATILYTIFTFVKDFGFTFCKIFNALLLCFIRFSVTLNKIDAC